MWDLRCSFGCWFDAITIHLNWKTNSSRYLIVFIGPMNEKQQNGNCRPFDKESNFVDVHSGIKKPQNIIGNACNTIHDKAPKNSPSNCYYLFIYFFLLLRVFAFNLTADKFKPMNCYATWYAQFRPLNFSLLLVGSHVSFNCF